LEKNWDSKFLILTKHGKHVYAPRFLKERKRKRERKREKDRERDRETESEVDWMSERDR
jgi:hypothetical protein